MFGRRLTFATICKKRVRRNYGILSGGIMEESGRTPQIISLLSLPRGLISGNAEVAHANIKTAIWGGAALLHSFHGKSKETNKQTKEKSKNNKGEKGTSWMVLKKGNKLNESKKRRRVEWIQKKGTSWMGFKKGTSWMVLKKGNKLNGSKKRGRIEWVGCKY